MTAVEPLPPRRRGRRPAAEDTRGAIIDAARAEFAERGYDGATLRGIARAAGVDPRLVHHYFDDKVDLFAATVNFPLHPQEVVEAVVGPGPDGVGERMVRAYLGVLSTPQGRQSVAAILSAVTASEVAARMVRQFVTREILARVVEALDVDRPHLRASLAASHLLGIALLRLVVEVEPLASADEDEIAAIVAPTLQRYLTAPDL